MHICPLFLAGAMMLSACSGLPPISMDASPTEAGHTAACHAVFVETPWQVVHSMTARMPDDQVYQGISVTRVFPSSGRMECVIMSIEGLVLFSGHFNGEIRVKRAIGPFESKGFARRVFADIRQVFLPPRGQLTSTGKNRAGRIVCRYFLDAGGYLDVVRHNSHRAELTEYSAGEKKVQSVSLAWDQQGDGGTGSAVTGPAARISIERHGLFGYRLTLERIEYNPVSGN